jgi:TM2 domain-containing membrane protein YozV
MDKATKAALYSALLFPGWGQFYLRCYKRGLIFFLPVLMGTIVLAWSVVRAGSAIIQAAPFKKGTVQVADIIRVSADALKAVDLSYLFLMLLLVAALWILSIVDAYQLGKKMVTISTTRGNPE